MSSIPDVVQSDASPGTSEAEVRRSSRVRRPPNRYGEWLNLVHSEEPKCYNQAVNSVDSCKWIEAMNSEIDNMNRNDVYTLVIPPVGAKIIKSKWVYKIKSDNIYKARLVAQGYSQVYGVDYEETFSPVVKFESIRTIFAIAVQNNLLVHQMDVTAAFLNGKLDKTLYMAPPEGYVANVDYVWELKKSIYGLKQSPRCWNADIDRVLQQFGLVKSQNDPCLYVASNSEGVSLIVAIYVDDIIIAGVNLNVIDTIKNKLCNLYDVRDLGIMSNFLGVDVVQSEEGIWMSQSNYCKKLLIDFGMIDSKPVATPMESNVKLTKATETDELTDKERYTSCIGSLLYLSVKTRPDIS